MLPDVVVVFGACFIAGALCCVMLFLIGLWDAAMCLERRPAAEAWAWITPLEEDPYADD